MNERAVLLVDDEEDLTWSISRSLGRDKRDIRVYCANSGDEAIDLLQKQTIDVIITDLRMPGVNGFDVIRFIRDNHLPTKIIVMTAYGSQEIEKDMLDSGCVFYIEKPFEISNLKQKIYAALDNSEPLSRGGGDFIGQTLSAIQSSKRHSEPEFRTRTRLPSFSRQSLSKKGEIENHGCDPV